MNQTVAALYQHTHEALVRFEAALAMPEATQTALLQQIIHSNQHTEFGRAHDFAHIQSYADFARRVPIGSHQSHHHALARMAAGAQNILTSQRVMWFEETGGSHAAAKLIPYTQALLAAFGRGVLPWLGDWMRQRPRAFAGSLFFVISPLTRRHTHTTGGIPLGSGNDLAYLGADLGPALAAQALFLPELTQAQSSQAWQWHAARLLLTNPNLSLMSAWSPTLLLSVFNTMHQQQDSLLATITDSSQRQRLSLALSKNQPDTTAIWPQLDSVSCWTSHTAAAPAAQLQQWLPHAHIQGKGLMATEGVTTLPFGHSDTPLLAINSHFYEFASAEGHIRLAHELTAHSYYRLMLTTQGGLYRYDTGDTVLVCGFEQHTPRLAFSGRADWVSDMVGEKLNEAFVRQAMILTHPLLPVHCLLQATGGQTPHYRLLAPHSAKPWLHDTIIRQLDDALSANPQYHYARRIGQLSHAVVQWVDDIHTIVAQHHRSEQRLGTRKTPLLLPAIINTPAPTPQ